MKSSFMRQTSNDATLSDFKHGFALGIMVALLVISLFVSVFQVNVTW
jgi:hypothetical protein